jgi:hypothetical protein
MGKTICATFLCGRAEIKAFEINTPKQFTEYRNI